MSASGPRPGPTRHRRDPRHAAGLAARRGPRGRPSPGWWPSSAGRPGRTRRGRSRRRPRPGRRRRARSARSCRPARAGCASAGRRRPLLMASPTGSDPVNEMPATRGSSTRVSPASRSPWTRFSTPGGTPASRNVCTSRAAVSGVSGDGLSTAVQPDSSAGATFHIGIATGKFHGVIRPTTPIGPPEGHRHRARLLGRRWSGRSSAAPRPTVNSQDRQRPCRPRRGPRRVRLPCSRVIASASSSARSSRIRAARDRNFAALDRTDPVPVGPGPPCAASTAAGHVGGDRLGEDADDVVCVRRVERCGRSAPLTLGVQRAADVVEQVVRRTLKSSSVSSLLLDSR